MADARPEVVVLGGGVAGLTAARALAAAGRGVVLVEARGRLGGRILTVRPAGCPWPLELGAEFAHGDPEATRRLVRAAGLTSFDARFEMTTLGGGERLPQGDELTGQVARLVDEVRARRPGDVSVGAFLDELTADDPAWRSRREAILLYVCGFHAADPERMSVHALVTEEDARERAPGADQRIVEGYDRVVDHLASGVDPASVWLRTVARRIDWEPGRVRVAVTTDGRWERVVEARAAVVALPLGVLQASEGEEGAVAIAPPPGHAAGAIARLASGPALHAVLHFARAFWEDEARGGERPWRDLSFFRIPSAPIGVWWTRLPLRTSVLTGWVGGPDAARLAGRPEGDVLEAALASLATGFGLPVERLRGELRSFHVHDWSADPFARGAYSYVPAGGLGAQHELARPVADTLFFAGEASHEGGDTGTVHAAIETGERAARLILGRLAPRG